MSSVLACWGHNYTIQDPSSTIPNPVALLQSRNNADFQQLLQICGLNQTLICDADAIYDLTHLNDRLVLGLKIPSLYNTSFTCGLAAAPSAAPASRDSG